MADHGSNPVPDNKVSASVLQCVTVAHPSDDEESSPHGVPRAARTVSFHYNKYKCTLQFSGLSRDLVDQRLVLMMPKLAASITEEEGPAPPPSPQNKQNKQKPKKTKSKAI